MEAQTNDAIFDFYGWLYANWKAVAAVAVGLFAVAAAITLYSWHSDQRATEAGEALLDVPGLVSPEVSSDRVSRDEFVKLTHDYDGTAASVYAELLAARTAFLDGKYTDAEQGFNKFIADHPNDDLLPMAQVGLGAALEGEGKLAEAMAKYKEVASAHATEANLIVPLKLTMGRLSEAQNKPDAAFAYYGQVANIRNPRDPWVLEALQRLRLLVAVHPELMPAQTKANESAPAPAVSTMLNPSAAETQMTPANGSSQAAPSPAPAPKSSFSLPPLQAPNNSGPVTKP